MTITGLPQPLPECSRCGSPMRRNRWAVATGLCRGCATPAEKAMAGGRAARLATVQRDRTGRRRIDARIDHLAAKRAARTTGGAA